MGNHSHDPLEPILEKERTDTWHAARQIVHQLAPHLCRQFDEQMRKVRTAREQVNGYQTRDRGSGNKDD